MTRVRLILFMLLSLPLMALGFLLEWTLSGLKVGRKWFKDFKDSTLGD